MKIVWSLVLLITIGTAAYGQKSGVVMVAGDSGIKNGRMRPPTPEEMLFRMLTFDPSLVGFARRSAWTASVVPVGGSKEARLQVNVCDLRENFCKDSTAWAVTLAGPLNADDAFTKLADLNGLAGSARIEMSLTTPSRPNGWFVALSAAYSQPSFSYRDSATLARHSVDHSAYAATAGVGHRWSRTALSGSFRVEQAYKSRASQSICAPAAFGPVGTESCSTVVLAPPSNAPAAIASMTFAWSLDASAAMHITLSRDIRNSVTGVDLPLWVVNDPAKGIGGGVRLGYTSDVKKLTVVFFVSTFKL